MSHYDEQPDGDIHGECAEEIHRLEAINAELLEELENCADLLNLSFPNVPSNSCIGVAIIKASAAIAKSGGAS